MTSWETKLHIVPQLMLWYKSGQRFKDTHLSIYLKHSFFQCVHSWRSFRVCLELSQCWKTPLSPGFNFTAVDLRWSKRQYQFVKKQNRPCAWCSRHHAAVVEFKSLPSTPPNINLVGGFYLFAGWLWSLTPANTRGPLSTLLCFGLFECVWSSRDPHCYLHPVVF